mgnify:CR=1 FL=1
MIKRRAFLKSAAATAAVVMTFIISCSIAATVIGG